MLTRPSLLCWPREGALMPLMFGSCCGMIPRLYSSSPLR
jgi:hypothetical protein